ncbi:hypothetical protein [Bradyrhizobium embrapense]|uniref:hypothetical protein n=1 Tax=Bradyrhizobium embrapense TaxID=630921 RepID=UPI0012F4A8A4|nr:hypothetical protein [Bradyrhizobium embrapense]
MPIELHERPSEFSYGYGVTREVERRLKSAGLSAVPFLLSLIQEAAVGFDVAFNVRGIPLMIQFKLGQAMRRFRPSPRPQLSQQFWRYQVDTAEPDGQFELLLKAEHDGARVFYVAPMFHDWEVYLGHYEQKKILRRSLIVTPKAIRSVLDNNSVPDGEHKVVYDDQRAYLCSSPLRLPTAREADIAEKVSFDLEHRKVSLGEVLEEVLTGFENRAEIRRAAEGPHQDPDRAAYQIPSDDGRGATLRRRRLSRFLESGRSRAEAIALVVGAETWSIGAQLIFVTRK